MRDDDRKPAAEVNEERCIPLVAIGGITSENIAALPAQPTGTRHIQVAVCQSVIGADDPAAAAANFKKALSVETAEV